jgi:hypothetical protein
MTEADTFEELVRRMARSMWDDPAAGRAEGDPVRVGGGRAEIDVLVTRSETIVIDATISSQAQVVRDKIQSLKSHRRSIFEKTGKPVRAFIVTKQEPTQHQIGALKDAKIDWILLYSYSQFRSLLVDASGTLKACQLGISLGTTLFHPRFGTPETVASMISPRWRGEWRLKILGKKSLSLAYLAWARA